MAPRILKRNRQPRLDPERPAIRFLLAGQSTDPETGKPHVFDLRDTDADAKSWRPIEEYLSHIAPLGLWDVRWCGDGCLNGSEARQLADTVSGSIEAGHAAEFITGWLAPWPDDLPGTRHHAVRVEWFEALRDFLAVCDGFSLQYLR